MPRTRPAIYPLLLVHDNCRRSPRRSSRTVRSMNRSHCVIKPALKLREEVKCLQLFAYDFPGANYQKASYISWSKGVDASLLILTKKLEDRPLLSTAKANYFPLNKSRIRSPLFMRSELERGGMGPLLLWRSVNRTGSLWRIATSECLFCERETKKDNIFAPLCSKYTTDFSRPSQFLRKKLCLTTLSRAPKNWPILQPCLALPIFLAAVTIHVSTSLPDWSWQIPIVYLLICLYNICMHMSRCVTHNTQFK